MTWQGRQGARGNLFPLAQAWRNLQGFLQRQHNCHAWKLAFKVLWLPSPVEHCCHVPDRERTISPRETNSRPAIETHPNGNLSVSPDLLYHSDFSASSVPPPLSWRMRRKSE